MCAWFAKPECPVDAATKDWIDRRWAWLTQELGLDRLRSARVILPLAEFFPDPFEGRPDDVQPMLERVCKYMGINPATVVLSLYSERVPVVEDGLHPGTSGLYQAEGETSRVWIESANLADPMGLVGTLAHELSHIHLLGHGRVTADEEDHEPLTDLLTVFLGLGIFTANSVIYEQYLRQGAYALERMGRRGYLTMPQFAYALALFARDRAETEPAWAEHLRPDVRAPFANACRFLAGPAEAPPAEEKISEHEDVPATTDEEVEENENARVPTLTVADLTKRLAAGERKFRKLNLQGLDLHGVEFCGCNMEGADLCGANLTDANLANCNLREADAQEAVFIGATLCKADLRKADLSYADLSRADMTGADIRGTDLRGAILSGAILVKTLRNATTDVTGTDLSTAITDIDLRREKLHGASAANDLTETLYRPFELLAYAFVILVFMAFPIAAGAFLDLGLHALSGTNRLPPVFVALGAVVSVVGLVRFVIRSWRNYHETDPADQKRQ